MITGQSIIFGTVSIEKDAAGENAAFQQEEMIILSFNASIPVSLFIGSIFE